MTHEIDSYTHTDSTRLNNPDSGLAHHEPPTDTLKTYSFDPNDSPALSWAGKPEAESFTVPTLSIHKHETVIPERVIFSVQSEASKLPQRQLSLFPELDYAQRVQDKLRAIDAYHHSETWKNRMIAGDSLVVMNSLLQKENMAGSVQTVYIDPPYGIKYGSNSQPFVNKKDVKDRVDEDLTREPEMIRAFRDTWELGIHSYLTYLRSRLLLVRELLSEEGSVFVQISDENVHLVRCLCDEVFSPSNFVTMIKFRKAGNSPANLIGSTTDYLVWYAKDKERVKYHQLYVERRAGDPSLDMYSYVELDDGTVRKATSEEMNSKEFLSSHRNIQYTTLFSIGTRSNSTDFVEFEGKKYYPPAGKYWKVNPECVKRLIAAGRIVKSDRTIRYKRYLSDSPLMQLGDLWEDTHGASDMRYVVQTSTKVIQRCILMTSDPGDLVLDITCGSGITAFTAEQWGRRWITCDTSRVAIAIARQRLLTASFPYYKLSDPQRGISSGFSYKSVPHITLKSIANNEPPAREILYDQPEIDTDRIRLSGPFTVEALPAPAVLSPEEAASLDPNESERQADWREQLLATGIRGRKGDRIRFSRIEPLDGTRWINARAWTDEDNPRTALVCFADTSTLMDSKRVSLAVAEALGHPELQPAFVIFAAFQFNPESQELINTLLKTDNLSGAEFLQVKMNDDLVTSDLKRKVKTDESFWLVGQPDVEVFRAGEGTYRVRVLGFDYYNVKTDKVESGEAGNIAMWMLDPDYNGMTMIPSQIFFPMEGKDGGWAKLAKTLKAEVDGELVDAYSGTESLAFTAKDDAKIAVKIIDDRGIESMRILTVRGAQ